MLMNLPVKYVKNYNLDLLKLDNNGLPKYDISFIHNFEKNKIFI